MNRLNRKTAVITGGAAGIGRAAAKRFIDEGAFVFIFGRRQDSNFMTGSEVAVDGGLVQI
jgi:NAD(P)-dependent dehydrogenase (short-subunit alcohol dehydrogenase family)